MAPGRVFLGLGSNLGSPAGPPDLTVQAAVRALGREPGLELVAVSSVFRSEPRGFAPGGPPVPPFANAVACVSCALEPLELLARCRALEERFGRVRGAAAGSEPVSRTLDVDVLLGPWVLAGGALVVPHPRLHERRFVLVPLAEIAPGERHPLLDRSIAELLAGCRDPGWVEPWPQAALARSAR